MAKESNKNYWIFGIILVIVAIFLFGNFGSLTGQQLRTIGPATALIRAHSCDADGTCETNNLQIKGLRSERGLANVGVCLNRNGDVTKGANCLSSNSDYCSGFDDEEIEAVFNLRMEGDNRFAITLPFMTEGATAALDRYVLFPGVVTQLTAIDISPPGIENDVIELTDVITGEIYHATIEREEYVGDILVDYGFILIEGIKYPLTAEYLPYGLEHVYFDYPQSPEGSQISLMLCF